MPKELIEGAKRGTIFELRPEDLVIIGLDTKDGPEHPLYDERIFKPLNEGTILNMMALGVQQTVNVVVGEGKPIVYDGRRRTMHAREANKRLRAAGEEPITVRCEAKNGKKVSENLLAEAMISLNELRENDDVLVKAAKAERMRARGSSDARIAVVFGVTIQAVRAWAKLSGLAPAVQDAVRDGRVSAHAAAELSDLPKNEQLAKLEEILASGVKPTANEIKHRVKPEPSGEPRPSGRVVKKIIAAATSGEDLALPEEFILALRWVRGEISAAKIKNLTKVLRKFETKAEAAE